MWVSPSKHGEVRFRPPYVFFVCVLLLYSLKSSFFSNAQGVMAPLPSNNGVMGQVVNTDNGNTNNVNNNGWMPSPALSSNITNNSPNASNSTDDGWVDGNVNNGLGPDGLGRAPRFIYPSLIVRYGASDIAVVAAGDSKNPLNITFDVTSVFLKPKSITLAYARKAFPNVFTNITQLSYTTTQYDWLIPSNMVEAKDYFLRIMDTDVPVGFLKDGNLRPIYSGTFYIYKRADLSITPPDLPFSSASKLYSPTWSSSNFLSFLFQSHKSTDSLRGQGRFMTYPLQWATSLGCVLFMWVGHWMANEQEGGPDK
ncbi:hypothetical protein HMI54_009430 [Coelomomyces lativittatus]|nr:hypothetical protein HMI56_003379 [Coelomomyces lativittatus]KAJ1501985.1 hypothetical protein HMI54_009430 [Coelomomyces lativittatus]KAJ1509350.1 hypothetical protein HMI55_007409 [Coelomomyces lativittatus]